MHSLSEIQTLTKEYADAHALVRQRVEHLQALRARYERRLLPGIKRAVSEAAERRNVLKAAIEASPELFVRPRSHTFFGVKVGFQKLAASLNVGNKDGVVARIKKLWPERASMLIKTEEKLVLKALKGLSVAELAKLSITVVEGTDTVLVEHSDDAVEKLVAALMKTATPEQTEEAATPAE
jgi:hypothetical protein